MEQRQVDVFINGAGPVGLLLAYQLKRLGHSIYIIDRDDKEAPDFPMYGRACTLYAGTLEILDRLDLLDDFAQEGLVNGPIWGYHDGERTDRKGEGMFDDRERIGLNTSYMPETLNLRLKYMEDIIRARLAELGVTVNAPVNLVHFKIDDGAQDGYKVNIVCQHLTESDTATFTIRSKYIIGSDGGGSAVRKIAGIAFEGARNDNAAHIVRLDGILETDIPEARTGIGLIQTNTHGQILWVPFDHNAARIGYTLSRSLFDKYGYRLTGEQAIAEAKAALAPHFKLDCKELHWYTVYGVQQFVAQSFQDRERILIAGDAGHTHSSALAQGMNTGAHDAYNLAWKLSGTIKGWYTSDVLATYTAERRPIAQQLIENDRIMAELIADNSPKSVAKYSGIVRENAVWVMGLGFTYHPNMLISVEASSDQRKDPKHCKITPGSRVYDALLQKPSIYGSQVRLNEIFKNDGRFKIMVFAGRPSAPGKLEALYTLRHEVDRKIMPTVDWLTIIAGRGPAIDEYLGTHRFGKGYFDCDDATHNRYGVDVDKGALLVVRPDAVLALATALDDFVSVQEYFNRFLRNGFRFNENAGSLDVAEQQQPPSTKGEFVIHGEPSGNDIRGS